MPKFFCIIIRIAQIRLQRVKLLFRAISLIKSSSSAIKDDAIFSW